MSTAKNLFLIAVVGCLLSACVAEPGSQEPVDPVVEPTPVLQTPHISTLELTNNSGSEIQVQIYAFQYNGSWEFTPQGEIMRGYFGNIQNAVIENGRKMAAGETVQYSLPAEARYYVVSEEAGTARPMPTESVDLVKESFPGNVIPKTVKAEIVRGSLVTVKFAGFQVWGFDSQANWTSKVLATPPAGAEGGAKSTDFYFVPDLEFKNDGYFGDLPPSPWLFRWGISCKVDPSSPTGSKGSCRAAYRHGTKVPMYLDGRVSAPPTDTSGWMQFWSGGPCREMQTGTGSSSNYCTFEISQDSEVSIMFTRWISSKDQGWPLDK